MFDQLSAEIAPSLIKGRHNSPNNNNKAKCIPGGTLRVLAGKKSRLLGIKLEKFDQNVSQLPIEEIAEEIAEAGIS
jgi:hypothetical protein